jgi:hypothetical protein
MVGILTVGAVYAFYGGTAANRRLREMAALALRRGFTFSSTASYDLAGGFPGFRPLHTGEDSYAYNIIRGTINARSVFAFDYHYQTNTEVDKYGQEHAYHYSFSAVIASSNVPLKSLAIRPKGLLTDVAVGDNAIEFESAEFNERYCVSAVDRRWAYDVLHPRTIELLLDAPAFHIEFDYNGAIAYQGSGARLSVDEMDAAITLLTGILDGLPEYLVQQQRGEP